MTTKKKTTKTRGLGLPRGRRRGGTPRFPVYVSLTISEEMAKRIHDAYMTTSMSVSDMIRAAIDEYLGGQVAKVAAKKKTARKKSALS